MEKFVVVDGNSLINRAFYGLPMLKSLSGKPCNAVYGFVNILLNLVLKEKPKYLVCVFDAGKHTFRHDIYAEYKGKRDHMPEDLATQLPMLKELLAAMKIKTIEMPEIEADDIVGSISRKFDAEFILLSGDKDLLQLINKNTTVWLTQKGVSQVGKMDEKALLEQFELKPYQIIELKSIMGDSSDNIPGVPGIGQKGAMDLLKQFDNLDNIYANLDKVPPRFLNKLNEGREMAYLSHQLATIKLDVDIPFGLDECEIKLPFDDNVYFLMKELDFKSMLNRKDLFTSTPKAEIEQENLIENLPTVEIETQKQFDEMMNDLGDSFALATDNFALYFAKAEKEFCLYKTSDVFGKNIDKLKTVFVGEKQKVCFDAKQIMHELSQFNFELNNYFDVSMAIYIANELDAELKFEDAVKLNNILTENKAYPLLKLKEIYITKLIKNAQLKLYSDIELPLVKVLFDMEQTGIKIDAQAIKELSANYHVELDKLTDDIYALAGEKFNINSPKQLQTILFDNLKIEYKGKKGTSIEVLNDIKDKHPIVEKLIRYRKVSKLISTYLDGMLDYVGADGKIHTTYMQRTTSTGRLSSREPNLQNLPIRDDEGRALRKMFASSFENGTIISADYNQIELRLIANFSGDENMIADYLSGKDIHSATASKIFGVPEHDVTPNMRRVAKSVNFGIIYGISAYGLSQNINTTPKEAGAFINKYLEIYPKVKEYGDKQIELARQNGYVSTIMGRVRHIPDINSTNHTVRGFAERVAKNMPLQGSASDIIKIAMINVFKRFNQEKLKSKLIIQIHDELVVDCFPGESEKVKNILKQEMENVVNLTVPLIANISEGKTLYDAK